jgi:hypothetical protein
MFSPPNALSKIKVSIICPWFKPLDDRLAGNTLLAIVSISNLRVSTYNQWPGRALMLLRKQHLVIASYLFDYEP